MLMFDAMLMISFYFISYPYPRLALPCLVLSYVDVLCEASWSFPFSSPFPLFLFFFFYYKGLETSFSPTLTL